VRRPPHVIEIFLQPGDFYFGDKDTRIRTILGSCVSITIWHPTRLIGGMCHYMLPFRGGKPAHELDGRYADEAMQLFLREIRGAKSHPSEYRLKVFGAGNMFPSQSKKASCGSHSTLEEMQGCRNVSCKNIAIARSLAALHGFKIEAENLGGDGHRHMFFDIWSGHAWVRHVKVLEQAIKR
jgi:chemotaxis protein CheD